MALLISDLTALSGSIDLTNDLIEVFDTSLGASRKVSVQTFFDSMPAQDYFMEVAQGNISGSTSVNKFGRTTNADNGVATDIWDGANATDDVDTWVAPTQARTHSITSTSTNDDGSPAGTGARTIRVYGLTSWSTAETSEDITLNGTTGVNTSNSYVIIHRMKVLTCGASGPNVGTIKATAATDGTVTAQINAGEGQTQMAVYGIPSTQKAYCSALYASIVSGTVRTVAANVALLFTPDVQNEETVFQVKHTMGLFDTGDGYVRHVYNPPATFAGPGILKLEATADGDNSDVSGGFDLVLVDN